jgi:hypothetical protein
MKGEIKSIREQARAIERDCERAAMRASLVSARWDRWNVWLGVLSTAAAAFAAFFAGNHNELSQGGNSIPVFLAQNLPGLAGGLALLSAILTSILTFLAPSKKAESFHESANKYRGLRERLRLFINGADAESAKDREALLGFLEEKQDIDVGHPIVPEWAYEKALQRLAEKRTRNLDFESFERKLKGQTVDEATPDRFWIWLDRRIFG